MNTVALALRSLDPHTFELLIAALLKARYPDIDIKHVNGQTGDQGLDVISGDLDERPTIWQCKSFEHLIKDSQKQQIRESLRSALKNFRPRRWVLCVSTDLDVKALRWWHRLAKSYANSLELQLWQASDIIQQLLYQDTIREQFFPCVTLNVPVIREVLAGTSALQMEDLAALNEQNAGAYLARLERMDSRFSYGITYTRNQAGQPPAPGTLLSVTRDHATIQVTPRDMDAVRADPPKVRFTLQGGGVEKFLDLQRTGKPVSFTSEELIGVTSDLDFLMPTERSGTTLHVTPMSRPSIPFRVTFGTGAISVVYEYVLFRQVMAGTQEGTFESVTPLPFLITFVLRRDKTGDVQFQDRSQGNNVRDVHRMVKAISAAAVSGEIEFYDLSRGAVAFSAALGGAAPDRLELYEQLFGDAAAIADLYNIVLTVPSVVTSDDTRALAFLRNLHQGFVAAAAEPITVTLRKGEPGSPTAIDGASTLRVVEPEFPEEVVVFGKRVLTGPVQYDIPNPQISELEAYREFLLNAPVGSTINLTLKPGSDITIMRLLPPLPPQTPPGK